MNPKISALLIKCIFCCQLFAQTHFVFSPINTSNGLSDNRVYKIFQLPDGRMVFITEGLVNIYNGTGFTYMHYDEQKAYSLSNYSGFFRPYIDNDSHLWIKNHRKLFLFNLSTEMFVPDMDSVLATYGIKNHLSDLFMDAHQNFWVLADDNLFYCNSTQKKTSLFATGISKINGNTDQLYDVTVVDSLLYLFFKSGLMDCYNIAGREALYTDDSYQGKIDKYNVNLTVVPYGQYLYESCNGFADGVEHSNGYRGLLLRYDIKNKKWDEILESPWQNGITIDNKGNCWVSSSRGLWVIDKKLQNMDSISQFHLVDGGIYESEINNQFIDKNGGLWLGPTNKGLLYYHPDRFKFRNFGKSFFKTSCNNLTINCLADLNGDILIGTQTGLFRYVEGSTSIKLFPDIPPDVQCNTLLKDSKGRIWLCTTNHGLFCFTGDGIKHYNLPLWCQNLYESKDGHFYLCTFNGFGIFEPESGRFEKIETSSELNHIYQLTDFGENKLLGVAFGYTGMFVYNTKSKTFSFPDIEKNWMLRQSNLKCHDIFTDHRGLIWFGTQDGLNVYDPQANSMNQFFQEDGLVNSNVRSITEDDSGRIWVSTSNGISCISITVKDRSYHYSFANFNRYDGVIGNEFLPRSVLKTKDNRLFWGGLDGFNELDLKRLDSAKKRIYSPLITGFLLFGNEIKVGKKYDGKIILKRSVSSTKRIDLKHFQNFFSFEFSALNYINPAQTYYRYKLDGVDATWNVTNSSNGIGQANYTNLSPGIYQFEVYAANSSRQWGHKSVVTIIIHPPLWETPIAYLLYAVLILSSLFFGLYFYMRWNKIRMQKKQKDELDQLKLSFFTNISHELRTPLTLILTPLNSIIKKQIDGPLKSQLLGIHRNVKDFLNLVNQLLDFRKLEMNGEIMRLNYCHIDEFLETIVHSFREAALEKGIDLTFELLSKNLYTYADKDKLMKIVNNLLSNALKFTGEGGKVTLTVNKVTSNDDSGSRIVIQVADNGCGIAEDDLPNIFDRFYQVKENHHSAGSGIGLHLVKQYVQLHGGRVMVESRLNEGSTFTVEIPCRLNQPEDDHLNMNNKENKSSVKILVVEDNREFRYFLYQELIEHYQVITAADGREGLKKAREQQPDLVISDIMMPEMSGTELCDKLKNDLQISHIPVILLTAKVSDEAQMEGFSAGADAYITKPFNLEALLLRIQKLIEQQEQRKKLFRKEININPGSITSTNLDEELIKKALAHIEKNMDNAEYSVEQLSKDMFMDRTNLYRKLLAIVNQTPTDFIRTVRLKRAAQLLLSGIMVSEVSEKVGFGNVSYFSKCFQKEFGMKPAQYKSHFARRKVEY